jgi:MFS family permease
MLIYSQSVPIFGYIADTYGPAKLSVVSSFLFGPAYLMASYVYANGLPYLAMVLAFAFVGAGTSSMYFSGVTTCAKNFTGNRGLALSLPIAGFGLSSLWQSQIVSKLFVTGTGDLEIARIFVVYSGFLFVIGGLGGLGLRVVEQPGASERERLLEGGNAGVAYGAIAQDDEEPVKKPLLNAATKEFLRDRTMWWFALGVFLVTGPGEAFINNVCVSCSLRAVFC